MMAVILVCTQYSLAAAPGTELIGSEMTVTEEMRALFPNPTDLDDLKVLRASQQMDDEPLTPEEMKRARQAIVNTLKYSTLQIVNRIDEQIQEAHSRADMLRVSVLLTAKQNLPIIRKYLLETKLKLDDALDPHYKKKGKCDPILNKFFRSLSKSWQRMQLGCDTAGLCFGTISLGAAAIALVALFPGHVVAAFLIGVGVAFIGSVAYEFVKPEEEGSCWP